MVQNRGTDGFARGVLVVVFTIYAAIVAFLAARWRRQARGYFSVLVAELVLVLLAWAHLQIPHLAAEGYRIFQGINIRPFQTVLYPYMAFVAALGFFVASLPPRAPLDSCWHCHYDLSSLLDEPGPIVCPECGREHHRPTEHRASGDIRGDLTKSDVWPTSPTPADEA